MKKATAYKRGETIYVHSLSKTTAGVWMLSLPVSSCAAADVSAAGRHLLAALHGSNENVPHPSSWKGLFDPVLQLAGVKSIATFNKKAKCVEIEGGGGVASIVPTRNLGPDDGFEPLAASVQQVGLDDPSQVGSVLLRAFDEAC